MSKTILIVEDNGLNMQLLCDVLDYGGFRTLSAMNGATALSLAREHRPDLVLMDIQLPDMSGLDVTRWIKRDPSLRHIPVVAVTGFAMQGDEDRILGEGCDGYVSKPIDIGDFLETVERFVNRAGSAAEGVRSRNTIPGSAAPAPDAAFAGP